MRRWWTIKLYTCKCNVMLSLRACDAVTPRLHRAWSGPHSALAHAWSGPHSALAPCLVRTSLCACTVPGHAITPRLHRAWSGPHSALAPCLVRTSLCACTVPGHDGGALAAEEGPGSSRGALHVLGCEARILQPHVVPAIRERGDGGGV